MAGGTTERNAKIVKLGKQITAATNAKKTAYTILSLFVVVAAVGAAAYSNAADPHSPSRGDTSEKAVAVEASEWAVRLQTAVDTAVSEGTIRLDAAVAKEARGGAARLKQAVDKEVNEGAARLKKALDTATAAVEKAAAAAAAEAASNAEQTQAAAVATEASSCKSNRANRHLSEQWYQVTFERGVGFRRTPNFTDRVAPKEDTSTAHSVMSGAFVYAVKSLELDESGIPWIHVADNRWLPTVSDSGETLLVPIASTATQITSNIETLVLGIIDE